MRFDILPRREGGAVCVRLDGEIDLLAGEALREAIRGALDDGTDDGVIIDLGEVTFLDCSAIGILVSGRTLAHERGRRYELRNARGLPLAILELTGMMPTEPPRQ